MIVYSELTEPFVTSEGQTAVVLDTDTGEYIAYFDTAEACDEFLENVWAADAGLTIKFEDDA